MSKINTEESLKWLIELYNSEKEETHFMMLYYSEFMNSIFCKEPTVSTLKILRGYFRDRRFPKIRQFLKDTIEFLDNEIRKKTVIGCIGHADNTIALDEKVAKISEYIDEMKVVFNQKTAELSTMYAEQTKRGENDMLLSKKVDFLADIINKALNKDYHAEYQAKRNAIKAMYSNIIFNDNSLQPIASGMLMAENKALAVYDQTGAIALLMKGIEVLFKDAIEVKLLKPISKSDVYKSYLTTGRNKPEKEKGFFDWISGNSASIRNVTMGNIIYFMENDYRRLLEYFAQKGEKYENKYIENMRNYIRSGFNQKIINDMRNGFAHEEVAGGPDLAKVVCKVNEVLGKMNSFDKS